MNVCRAVICIGITIAESYALKLDCPVLGTSVTFANGISVSFSA